MIIAFSPYKKTMKITIFIKLGKKTKYRRQQKQQSTAVACIRWKISQFQFYRSLRPVVQSRIELIKDSEKKKGKKNNLAQTFEEVPERANAIHYKRLKDCESYRAMSFTLCRLQLPNELPILRCIFTYFKMPLLKVLSFFFLRRKQKPRKLYQWLFHSLLAALGSNFLHEL